MNLSRQLHLKSPEQYRDIAASDRHWEDAGAPEILWSRTYQAMRVRGAQVYAVANKFLTEPLSFTGSTISIPCYGGGLGIRVNEQALQEFVAP